MPADNFRKVLSDGPVNKVKIYLCKYTTAVIDVHCWNDLLSFSLYQNVPSTLGLESRCKIAVSLSVVTEEMTITTKYQNAHL